MQSLKTLIQIFSSFNEAIYIVDKNRKILYFNPIAEQITGFKANDIVGKYCQNDTLNHIDEHGVKLCIKDCPLVKAMQRNIVAEHDIYLHHKAGHRVPVKVKTIPYIEDENVVGGIEVFNLNNKERFQLAYDEAKIKINYIDPLTKVFNRYFLDFLMSADSPISNNDYELLFIDIDNFKYVNDTYGHLIGDELLVIVANTMSNTLSIHDYLIRFGGDEFIILIKKDATSTSDKAELIRRLIENSSLRSLNYRPTVSIGLSTIQGDETLKDVISHADKALYKAKKTGKNKLIIAHK